MNIEANYFPRETRGTRSRVRHCQTMVAAAGISCAISLTALCQNAVGYQPPAASVNQASAITPQKPVAESPELSDRLVMLAVEVELLSSEAVNGHLVDVDVDQAIVTLSGRLKNILAKQIAVGLAERVRGVTSVVDQIAIVVERRPDAELTTDIQAALKADPATHELQAIVQVTEGTLTLSGTVSSYGLKTLAGEVAMGVKGVAAVKNDLQVKGANELTDEQLQQEIRELYRFTALLDDVELEVSVKNARVVLNGTVASSFQKSYAEDLARRAGAKDVDNRGIIVSWRHTNPLLRRQRYQEVTDDEIRDAVQRAFQHDPRVLSFTPDVQVDHGTVTLTGEVGHLTAKAAAERDALQTIGVRRVKNNLRVRWPEETPSDEAIAKFTREALMRDPYVERHNIIVECGNAHVSLYGTVDTWMMWQTAMDQAIAAGARRPHNMIEVRYGLPSGPHYYGPHDYVPR